VCDAVAVADPVPEMREWGLVPAAELERIVVISPHLDDGVLGCGRLLAAHPGSVVVTVYAGAPDPYPDPVTGWDSAAGFGPGDDVLASRKREDVAALSALRAEPRWLDFVEHQYLDRPDWVLAEAVTDRLAAEVAALRPTAVFAPFGIANPDHAETHTAAMQVRERLAGPAWFLYEDFGYKHIPGLLAWRVAQLFRRRVWPTPVALDVGDLTAADATKRHALAAYRSQVRALESDWRLEPKLVAAEQYWRLADPPVGWEELSNAT
jgi:LmbE family N-acetylglucosaminyl deacetylase